MASRRRLPIIAGIIATCFAVGYATWHFQSHQQKTAKAPSPSTENHYPSLIVEQTLARSSQVKPAKLDVYVKAPGIIDFHPKHALRIHPTFPGVILRVLKNLGDPVKAGETLASLESNVGIQIYSISSPISGTVLARNVGAGQSVVPEEEIFSVGDVTILQAKIAIAARDFLKVKSGQDIFLLAEKGQPIRAKVTFVSPILTEETRTATALVDVSKSYLRPGMYVTGAAVTHQRQAASTLPLSFCENTAPFTAVPVTVVSSKGLENREIFFGERDYFHCEVRQGVHQGEHVVPRLEMAAFHKEEKDDDHHD
jgi:cobalt-zinc-cadmium efflux system membrane fusion protein